MDGGIITTHIRSIAVVPHGTRSASFRLFLTFLFASLFCLSPITQLRADENKSEGKKKLVLNNEGKFVAEKEGTPKKEVSPQNKGTAERPPRRAQSRRAAAAKPTSKEEIAHKKTSNIFDNSDGKSDEDNVAVRVEESDGTPEVELSMWEGVQEQQEAGSPSRSSQSKPDAKAQGPGILDSLTAPFKLLTETNLKYVMIAGGVIGLFVGLVQGGGFWAIAGATGYGAIGGLLVGILFWALSNVTS